jgi:hypothetical protein
VKPEYEIKPKWMYGNHAGLLMLIGALSDIAEGNNSPYAKEQLKLINEKLDEIFLYKK